MFRPIAAAVGVATIATALCSASAVPAEKSQSLVEVDGHRYRVLVKNGTDVYVYQKAPFLDLSPSELDRRRRAVPIATGCQLRDAVVHGGDLRGMLDCTAHQSERPSIQ